VEATVPVKAVRANRGKWLRAEPVAALYQQGRVRHAGRFPALGTRCAISVRTGCPPAARPIVSTRSSGR
jgi:phage terminase large subunit-like protein